MGSRIQGQPGVPATRLRRTGLGVVGDVPWGTHLCLFYETKQDLVDSLVSFFKAGLENGEYCLWVASEPVSEREARAALRRSVPGFARHVFEHRMEFVPHENWYLRGKVLDLPRVMRRWNDRLDRAIARGHPGMRAGASVAWLKDSDWRQFSQYEGSFDATMARRPVIALCAYPVATSGADRILNAVRTHRAAVAVRKGRWEVLETSQLKRSREENERLKSVLEQRVIERTDLLRKTNASLTQEIADRARSEAERELLFNQVSASREQLQVLSRRLLQMQETERRVIARELHDEIGQLLTALRLMLTLKPDLLHGKASSRLADARSIVQSLLERVRNLALDLRPAMLDELGLVRSLMGQFRRFTKRTNVRIRFDHAQVEGRRFAPEVETAAYRIVQEALTNVARHAGVARATVRLRGDSRSLSVLVEDSGRGFSPLRPRSDSSTGLIGMQERARLLGGSLAVASAPGAGTRITATLPAGAGPLASLKPRRRRWSVRPSRRESAPQA